VNIIDATRDLFPWFAGESWLAGRVLLAALFNLPMSDADMAVYRRCTQRQTLPTQQAREAWLVVGRRGGKSQIAALVAVWLALFRDHRPYLSPGEVATVAIVAADRRQARVIMRYVTGLVRAVPMLAGLVTSEKQESLEFAEQRTVIEVHTASFRLTRGYTLAGVLCDEVAFWRSEDSANPDLEIINGLRPGLATIPGALLLGMSSPYARRGVLWEQYRKHYGQDGDPVLVWRADTRTMNPTVAEHLIADAYADDEASAAAEYGAEFRRDVESFVDRDAVAACVIPGRAELPRMDTTHVGFCDPSGGSQDSMTLAIAHVERGGGRIVLDALREVRPPFSPDHVAGEFAGILRQYGVSTVVGDRYGGEWPRERFRHHGISYQTAEKPKSDLYRELLPLITGAKVELLDHPRLIAQLCALERRTARGGRDSIDHPPRGHDDVVNAAAGALVLASGQGRREVVEQEIYGI
jgi:hypothetical protein